MRFTLFHFFYSTSFTVLFLLLAILVLITPADTIVQALIRNERINNVFIVAGCYVLTALIALIIYVSRIYSVRRLMADIPKFYAPVRKVYLRARVHKAITANLSRSAVIAVQSRPREGGQGVWGEIKHPGWSDGTGRLPNVQYLSVVKELPNLLEIEALSLRPPESSRDGLRTPTSNVFEEITMPDQEVVRRQPHMSFRAYLNRLAAVGYVRQDVADLFMARYERARFRSQGEGIEEREFMELMHIFAGLLKTLGDDLFTDSPSTSSRHRNWEPRDEDSNEEDHRECMGLERRDRYNSSGYETTSTEREEGEGLRSTPDRLNDGFVVGVQRRRPETIGSTNISMRRTTTATTVGSITSPEDNEIEMVSLRPRGTRRLSARTSAGTFG
ncbi:unnamed protein product [Tuber melanosporum]|uniref:Defect at low temperature protein 1 n=1 Tax=Tuber melanosporum (strain Mel28) TaxID=656061 RepID=D5G877_TUBMM|nr:uncharacterized protein GSTUM_00002919001 [Tuber melanosporum]CAZ80720.1 unnamed protein product [Tuber melanosporum]